MLCPKCSMTTKVVDSRPRENKKMVWRKRRCDSCNYVFETIESYTPDLNKNNRQFVKDRSILLDNLEKAINKLNNLTEDFEYIQRELVD